MLIHHSTHYEVQLQSNGSKSFDFPKGTWFQTGPFMQPFPTYAAAEDAVGDYQASGEYRYLPMRIVVVQTSTVTVKTINGPSELGSEADDGWPQL